jgi:hypothetical protein
MIAYLEDAPADTGTAARGLSKAIIPLLRSIDGDIRRYVVNQTHSRLSARNMPAFVREKLDEAPEAGALARNAWKLPLLFPLPVGLPLMARLGPRQPSARRAEVASILWAPIGVDPGTLVRAWALARRSGLKLHLYFVDDVETHPSNAGTARLGSLIARILRDADRVYTITAELGALFTARYGVKTRALPLIPEPAENTPAAPQALIFAAYLGSINHLYEDGLRQLIAATRTLRERSGQDLRLRFFSDERQVRQICDGDMPAWITPGPENDDAVIHRQLAAATLCFLPNSFAEDARTMVSTSFPSKLLDYLVCARAIVVFAPDYAIARKIFAAEAIPHVVASAPDLLEALAALVAGTHDARDTYLSLVARHFSGDTVQRALKEPW